MFSPEGDSSEDRLLIRRDESTDTPAVESPPDHGSTLI